MSITYLHPEQITRLLAVIQHPRDRAIFTVAYFRGLRASEVRLLELADYRPDAGRLRVKRLKNSVSGEYKVTPAEKHALAVWLRHRGPEPGPLFRARSGRGVGRSFLDRLMKAYAERAGLPRNLAHFHVLKHSIATHLAERGEDAALIQDWLGHKDIRNTMVYLKITNRARDQMAERVAGWS